MKKNDKFKKDNFRNDFKNIRKILNKWDPIDVADSVDDEYDSINYAVISEYNKFGNTESIKNAIIKYLIETMGFDRIS